MFKKHFSFGRAVITALVLSVSLGFTSCQPETQIKEVEKIVEKEVEKIKEVEKVVYVPGVVYKLTEKDPVCGYYTGNAGNFWIYPDFFFNQSVASTSECGETDEVFKKLTLSSWYQDVEGNWKEASATYKFQNDGNPVYAVYNDEEKLSGVLIFKTKYSAWGTPVTGSYYGVKFQINKDDSSKVLLEGGYNADASYNNVTDLATAVTMFAFDNSDYYSTAFWNETGSGATRSIE